MFKPSSCSVSNLEKVHSTALERLQGVTHGRLFGHLKKKHSEISLMLKTATGADILTGLNQISHEILFH